MGHAAPLVRLKGSEQMGSNFIPMPPICSRVAAFAGSQPGVEAKDIVKTLKVFGGIYFGALVTIHITMKLNLSESGRVKGNHLGC